MHLICGANMEERRMKRTGKLAASFIITLLLVVVCALPVFGANKHTVTFHYGTKIKAVTVDHGGRAVLPTDTAVPGYIFVGWIGNAENVTEDRVVLGAYTKVDETPVAASEPSDSSEKTYTVKFVDSLTDATYFIAKVKPGEDVYPPEIPHHEGWHFDYYDGSYQKVDSDRTVTVHYEEDWHWIDEPSEHWWEIYSTDDPDYYQKYWWM